MIGKSGRLLYNMLMATDFNLTAKVHQVNDAFHQVSAQVNLQHINIQKLFYGFDHFGQTAITHKNLKGVMDAKSQHNRYYKHDAGKICAFNHGKW